MRRRVRIYMMCCGGGGGGCVVDVERGRKRGGYKETMDGGMKETKKGRKVEM